MRNKLQGYSLIELIVFIVVVGIALAAVMMPLNLASQNSPNPNYQTTALQLAQERMELILGWRYLYGYTNVIDPCTQSSPPTICTALTGFTVTAAIAGITTGEAITVTASGFNNTVTLTAQVGNY